MAAFYDKQGNIDALVAAMRAKGYNDAAIAGMLGRAQRESSFNTAIVNPNDAGNGNDSVGLFQWNRDRLDRLKSYAADRGAKYTDPNVQAQYAVWEFTDGPEKATGARLRDAQNVQDGVNAAMLYTRPKGTIINGKLSPTTGLHYKETTQSAADYYKMISGKDYDPQMVAMTPAVEDTQQVAAATPRKPGWVDNIKGYLTGKDPTEIANAPEVKPDPAGTLPTDKKDTPFGWHLPKTLGDSGIKTDNALGFFGDLAKSSQEAANTFNASVAKGGRLEGKDIPFRANVNAASVIPAGSSPSIASPLMPLQASQPLAAKGKTTAISLNDEEKKKQLLAMLSMNGLFGGAV